MAVAGLYLFLDCTCLCALHRRLETTHKGSLLPAPCLYVSVKVDRNEKYHQRHKKKTVPIIQFLLLVATQLKKNITYSTYS